LSVGNYKNKGAVLIILGDKNVGRDISLNRSARKRIYAGKWTYMVYQLQMARLWSILPRTNLIDRKCCSFNGEMDNVFGLWSKTYF
jgi:hypothetical protein